MRVNDIKKLTETDFRNILTEENFKYIKENHNSVWVALEQYKEGAKLSEEIEYVNVNEYFEAIKEQKSYLE